MGSPTPVVITDSNGNAFTVTGTTSGQQVAAPTPVVLTDVNGNALQFEVGSGSGSVVFQNEPTLNQPILESPTFVAGGLNSQLATPAAPTVTQGGTPGTTDYSYTLSGYDQFGCETKTPTATQTTAGASTLNSTNFNVITAPATLPVGQVGWNVYRTASSGTPSTTGIIGQITTAGGSLNDIGITADGSTVPSWNETGMVYAVPPAGPAATAYGQFVLTPFNDSSITGTEGAAVLAGNSTPGTMKVVQFTCTKTATCNSVSLDVTTNETGSSQLTIYRGDGGRKLFDVNFATAGTGALKISSTGVSGFAFPFTFYAGRTYMIGTSSTNASTAAVGLAWSATFISSSFFNQNHVRVGYSANSVAAGVAPAITGVLTSSGFTPVVALWEP